MARQGSTPELQRGALEAFHAFGQKVLEAVLHREGEDGEAIALIFGDGALQLKSDPDLDQISVTFGPLINTQDYDDLTGDAPWSRFIGKPFSWGWLTVNQRGDLDGALLSFDGVVPEVGVTVVASSLEILLLSRASA